MDPMSGASAPRHSASSLLYSPSDHCAYFSLRESLREALNSEASQQDFVE